ncbi:MAG: lipopolysaccharide transport periplasmic protein LptA [Zoogloeaceae bacterium]|jgi:lipopolysaccharide export system protein LptA|nr:lipopolysaccharide transport periplasmic protein LptA [Zoogloeaceae bacterium]
MNLARFPRPCLLLLLSSWLALFSPGASAELADRNKPISLEADRITIDDIQRVQVFEGNVVLTQGTLMIHSDKIVITEDARGFQRGVASAGPGGLARFRQKREGREEWVEGEAERIEYDTHSEVAEFFRRAWVKNGSDQLRGEYIWYDGIYERYLASPGETSAQDPLHPSRVRVTISPRNKEEAPAENPPPDAGENGELHLKNAPALR